MAPTWLTTVGWVYLSICFACAGAIGYDIAVNRRRQPMGRDHRDLAFAPGPT
jgi:hypothetical protein